MRALLIDAEVLRRVQAAMARARAKPIPLEIVQAAKLPDQGKSYITLEERRSTDHVRPQAEHVEIPVGYRLSISYEHQPVGLVAHFSISVDAVGKLPHQEAVRGLLALTGYDMRMAVSQWIEEFTVDDELCGLAVNFVFLAGQPQEAGTA